MEEVLAAVVLGGGGAGAGASAVGVGGGVGGGGGGGGLFLRFDNEHGQGAECVG